MDSYFAYTDNYLKVRVPEKPKGLANRMAQGKDRRGISRILPQQNYWTGKTAKDPPFLPFVLLHLPIL